MTSIPLTQASLLWALLFFATTLQAQWSVIEDDPRERNPKRLYEVFTKEAWNQSNFASEEDLQWFRDAKYGMFLHFGLSTYKNAELSWGVCKTRKLPDQGSGPYPESEWTTWPEKMELPEFDARKLVAYAEEAGMKYIVVIAKHHDGFHMWDTAYSDFKITNTPFGRDYLKEIADACREAGMKFGVYYSQRDWYHPDYGPVDPEKSVQVSRRVWEPKPGESSTMGDSHQQYLEYQFKVCQELSTKYGKLDIFWWDAAYWGGMFSAEMWDAEKLTRMIRDLQPGILMNNRTGVPGDFDTPEQRIGMFQNHRPWESCITLCKTWCYSDTPVKTPQQLVEMLTSTVVGDGNLLISWGPQWNGAFHPDQIEALREAGRWIKKNKEAIYGTRGGPWKPAQWGGSACRDNVVYLHIQSLPENKLLTLTGLSQKVLSAGIHGGEPVPFTQAGDSLQLELADSPDDGFTTVVELLLDAPVKDIIETTIAQSFFDSPEYGRVISRDAKLASHTQSANIPPANHAALFAGTVEGPDFAFESGEAINPNCVIDLGQTFSVTGIRLRFPEGSPDQHAHITVSVSSDQKTWEEIALQATPPPIWEIAVTSYTAGAYIPGKPVRYIKVERELEKPDTLHLQAVEVFGEQ